MLTGGLGSVGATLAGVLLLGLIFNVLNFENGLGWISLSAYWQSVVRGAFLFIVVATGSGRLFSTSATESTGALAAPHNQNSSHGQARDLNQSGLLSHPAAADRSPTARMARCAPSS